MMSTRRRPFFRPECGLRPLAALSLAALALAACERAEGVDVQPLPPLERPSMALRAGLAEVQGTWRSAGFEVEPEDSALVSAADSLLRTAGTLTVETQRLDSIAGRWRDAGGSYAVIGELRRDGTIALVVGPGADSARFVAGRVRGDTLWIELTSLPAASSWPRGSRAALVRIAEGERVEPFVRLLGGAPLPRDSVRPDTTGLDSLAVDSAGPLVPAPGIGAGVGETRPPPARDTTRRTPPRETPPARPPPPPAPREEPEPERPSRQRPEPAPPPREEPEPAPPPSRPAPSDTVRFPPRTPRPEPERPVEPTPVPERPAPRDTVRFPTG